MRPPRRLYHLFSGRGDRKISKLEIRAGKNFHENPCGNRRKKGGEGGDGGITFSRPSKRRDRPQWTAETRNYLLFD